MQGTAEVIQTWREILEEAKANKDRALVMAATKRLRRIAAACINPKA
jgi:hypothetical protein